MAQYTTNYSLKKPEENDYYSVNDYNGNFDTIDTNLRRVDATAGRKNLLDNWDFRNPINQKGKATYSGTQGAYTIDRWRSNVAESIITINNGFIRANNSAVAYRGVLFQAIEFFKLLSGKTVTLSVEAKVSSGHSYQLIYGIGPTVISQNSTGFSNNDYQIASWTFTVPDLSSATSFHVGIAPLASALVDIQRAKLEVGETSTLSSDLSSNYSEELLKCQRYFQVFSTSSAAPISGMDARPSMRLENPTGGNITISGNTRYSLSCDL